MDFHRRLVLLAVRFKCAYLHRVVSLVILLRCGHSLPARPHLLEPFRESAGALVSIVLLLIVREY